MTATTDGFTATALLTGRPVRPTAGRGIVGRSRSVVFAAGRRDPSQDDLLAELISLCTEDVGAIDGRRLVRRLAVLVAGSDDDPPDFCVVALAGDDLVVFVHGAAEVQLRASGGTADTLVSGRDSVAWVDRVVSHPVVEVLATVTTSGEEPSALCDLRDGIVPGGGFRIGAPGASVAGSDPGEQPAAAAPSQPGAIEPATSDPSATDPATDRGAPPAPPAHPPQPEPDFESVLLIAADPPPPTASGPQPQSPPEPVVGPPTRSGVEPAEGPADEPTAAHPVVDAGASSTVEVALPAPPPGSPVPVPAGVVGPVMVEGVTCKRGHFNDPRVLFCAQCGIGLVQQTLNLVPGERPSLGVLVLDDGTTFLVDTDYVVGREPTLDGDVQAGNARPLVVTDAAEIVSRSHLAVQLSGWEVRICDRGSANGTTITPPGASDPIALTAYEPRAIEPGTTVTLGRQRAFVFESHRRA